MQMAVKLRVEVVKTKLVRVETPNANRNLLASAPSGSEKPGCISRGITKSLEIDLLGTSLTGSLTLGIMEDFELVLFKFSKMVLL